ncbi:AraC family transcriptional regulator [Sphingobacterium sp. lm-10]|uniref:helix-turn-helix domain-containing protein n=1 Tax=Sphingobacterium sp. lm-10 TaxID=2944904 RepID=UPI002020C359|nr:AraC family transcriptional regulator [Sphingobacterium sp. lm-10]MCL7987696.1 AraC family transcriptional regulator [Sphingobacterium sp. lm-10]
MTLHIKNMVCNRCIMVVQEHMNKWGLPVAHIALGEVSTPASISPNLLSTIRKELEELGFGLIDDKRQQTVERIKNAIIELIYQKELSQRINLSNWLSEHLNQDYAHLSAWFSEVESTTIEKFFIAQKIERVKELLHYEELTLTQIADQLHYSSVAYLSNQFKKVTGLSPSQYKQSAINARMPLDAVKSYK